MNQTHQLNDWLHNCIHNLTKYYLEERENKTWHKKFECKSKWKNILGR